jgi:hypothetical protein
MQGGYAAGLVRNVVTSSVTVCSTCSRAFASMKTNRSLCTRNSIVPAGRSTQSQSRERTLCVQVPCFS